MTTTYKILKRDGDGRWQEHAVRDASSGARAISSLASDEDVVEGEYLAIPQRSYRPHTVKVEKTTKITVA